MRMLIVALAVVSAFQAYAASPAIKTFRGSGGSNTRPFTVEDGWEVQWDAKGDIFQIFLNTAEEELIRVIANSGSGIGSSYLSKGGEYYLTVNTVDEWEIKIVQLGGRPSEQQRWESGARPQAPFIYKSDIVKLHSFTTFDADMLLVRPELALNRIEMDAKLKEIGEARKAGRLTEDMVWMEREIIIMHQVEKREQEEKDTIVTDLTFFAYYQSVGSNMYCGVKFSALNLLTKVSRLRTAVLIFDYEQREITAYKAWPRPSRMDTKEILIEQARFPDNDPRMVDPEFARTKKAWVEYVAENYAEILRNYK